MIKTEIIKGKIFVEQTTYYIYNNEKDYNDLRHSMCTSSKETFNKQKQL